MTMNGRRALLVGVPRTTSADFELLPSVEKDIPAMERALESHHDGSTNFDVTCMIIDEASERAKGDVLNAVEVGLDDSSEHFLFYFSGHGTVTDFGLQLIMPQSDHEFDSGIFFDVLLRRFNLVDENTEITVILDCCFSGAAGDDQVMSDKVLRRFTNLRDGMTILASSRRDLESSANPEGLSDFTQSVVASLSDKDRDIVDVLDIYKNARETVSGQIPALRTSGSRYPAIKARDQRSASLLEV